MNSHEAILKQIQESPDFRKSLTQKSFYWFFVTYFPHYITCPTADFQKEIFKLLQNDKVLRVAITAFRGSAKSTIATLAYAIWAMVGQPNRKYILLVSQTQELAKQILTNIKQELASNDLLSRDFGPFNEDADEWRANSLVVKQYSARISAISQSEKIRGLRHKQYRPDLIVIDDVEDLESVKTKESRNSLWEWLTGEVIPIGTITTKIVIVGNLLHEDSLMMRLKQSISSGQMVGVYKEYPLIDEQRRIAWKGQYPTMAHIEAKRRDVADEYAWYREYLLQIISDDRRVVQRNWIHRGYTISETDRRHMRLIGIGTDLAISPKDTADFTALVPFMLIGHGDELKIYILPYLINKRLNFPDTIREIQKLSSLLEKDYKRVPRILVENVGYQVAVAQQLKLQRVIADPVDIKGMNKQTRLEIASPYIRRGNVLFPQVGAEELISQIVNFGIEKHDDLADAFTIALLKILELDRPSSNSSGAPQQRIPRLQKDPISGEWRDPSVPITAGMLDMKF